MNSIRDDLPLSDHHLPITDGELEEMEEIARRKDVSGLDTVALLEGILHQLRNASALDADELDDDETIASRLKELIRRLQTLPEIELAIRALNNKLDYITFILAWIGIVMTVGLWHFW
ncbi:hypothetical protein GOL39_28735 [Sinorhizobium medicae]|uniref:hypothetical protein n=1 Tax=Rhizobium meliloti TaxID=382 RepID=UPI000FD917A9|nr:hypothetical protein [Sinorhizobium meliloti]MDX0752895.1 hypothetical protein [Sinorhizobium medicae]MDX0973766.1 hypothetical protein [Sinorhizobium medicae]MDX1146550.1 hypothetical protein [Sinorhizobium medicae]RVO11004.1 hypothetical protein CN102_04995 [Sinorhizobium meliloti]